MAKQRTSDTVAELAVRRILHRSGLRYRVDAALPSMPRRRADILFTKAKVAVFIDGCFWHSCPDHGTKPKSNADWWLQKLATNVARDADTNARLRSLGWTVLRFWEHQHSAVVAAEVEKAVRAPTRTRDAGSNSGKLGS